MTEEKKVYVKGFYSYAKKENTPEWVLGSLIINVDEFIDFITGDGEGEKYLTEYKDKNQLQINITQGREGKMIFTVNTYHKTPAEKEPEPKRPIPDDDLPF